MAKPQLTLYYDIVSPFAYIALYVLNNSKIFEQCDLKFIPCFLGGIMKECNNTPPINIKNKDQWINTQRLRVAHLLNVPVAQSVPPSFPTPTLPLMRHLAALSLLSPEHLVPASLALYDHYFVQLQPIGQPVEFLPTFEEVLGKDLAGRVAAEANGRGKELLLANTKEAVGKGAFGMPWFVARDAQGEEEGFWGCDHLGLVIEHLGLDRGEEKAWRSML